MKTIRASGKTAAALMAVAGASASALAGGDSLALLFPFDSNNPAGWTQSMGRNDDGSTGSIPLPFDFCFYGNDRNSVFINNNGNLTFSAPFGGFTPSGFPLGGGFDMIAPFWGDVDTRNSNVGARPTNLVWHRFIDTSGDGANDTFVVTWDAVGWYSQQNNERNTFQVAITNNLAQWSGRNVAFSYGEMEWTTGQASGGGPYGGSPATVGINQGNGTDFLQIGRFDHAGVDYDGPGGNADGAQYLNYQRFFFDICNLVNQPPVATGIPAGGCFTVGAPDLLNATITLIGPEVGDAITSITLIDHNGAQAAGLIVNTMLGDPGTVDLLWATDPGDVGTYNFDLIFTDSFMNTTTERFCINVVPAPGAFGLLAIGGLLASRRRRA